MAFAILDAAKVRGALAELGLTAETFCSRHGLRAATLSNALTGKPVSPWVVFTISAALAAESRAHSKWNPRP